MDPPSKSSTSPSPMRSAARALMAVFWAVDSRNRSPSDDSECAAVGMAPP
ncbi:hypothetical protein [Glycomyces arizonensis]|nr:hypothetical protein [Glycomyces arizonensis]